jgi:RNA polymerase sigma-70 factor (ECF subfamily)
VSEVPAPDVVLIADGGGLRGRGSGSGHGAETVARVLARAGRPVAAAFETTTVWLDGAPAGRFEIDGEPTAVSGVVEHGLVIRVYLMRNPRKPTRLDEPAELAR